MTRYVPYKRKNARTSPEKKPIFKENDLRDLFEILEERHGTRTALEIMKVKSAKAFQDYCNNLVNIGRSSFNVHI